VPVAADGTTEAVRVMLVPTVAEVAEVTRVVDVAVSEELDVTVTVTALDVLVVYVAEPP
jgi:hypothetical protein